jgi:hypothetical protein
VRAFGPAHLAAGPSLNASCVRKAACWDVSRQASAFDTRAGWRKFHDPHDHCSAAIAGVSHDDLESVELDDREAN